MAQWGGMPEVRGQFLRLPRTAQLLDARSTCHERKLIASAGEDILGAAPRRSSSNHPVEPHQLSLLRRRLRAHQQHHTVGTPWSLTTMPRGAGSARARVWVLARLSRDRACSADALGHLTILGSPNRVSTV